MSTKDIHLRTSLNDTIAWARARTDPASPAGSLRSPELLHGLSPAEISGLQQGAHQPLDLRLPCDLIARNRRSLLSASCAGPPTSAEFAHFIVFDTVSSFHCGLAQQASSGYFDAHDAPPWDTWVYFGRFRGCLDRDGKPVSEPVEGVLSWVPPALAINVERGMTETVGFALFRLTIPPWDALIDNDR